MIGRLRGTLASRQPPWLLVDVAGVGYELQASMSTIYDLPATGGEVTLLTHQVVRDDSVDLYGFGSEAERGVFRELLKVTGIGAKIALAVLSGVSNDEFTRLVQSGDVTALTRVPGIGKKTAERIIMELRDRLDGAETVTTAPAAGGAATAGGTHAEAEVALQQLGYKAAEATRLIGKVAAAEDTSETIIRKALRHSLGS